MIQHRLFDKRIIIVFLICFLLSFTSISVISIENSNDLLNKNQFSLEFHFKEPIFSTIEKNQNIIHCIHIDDLPLTASPAGRVVRVETEVSETDGTVTTVEKVIEPRGVAWGTHAANMAWVTMQRPMRVAIHAQDMLP